MCSALGANRTAITAMILFEGLRLTGAGLLLGLAAACLATGTLKTLLFEVEPYDPVTLAGGSSLLLAVALVACSVPARRAARIDPLMALRAE